MDTRERRLRTIGTMLLLLLLALCVGVVIHELQGAEEILVCFIVGLVFGGALATVADPLYEEWHFDRKQRAYERARKREVPS